MEFVFEFQFQFQFGSSELNFDFELKSEFPFELFLTLQLVFEVACELTEGTSHRKTTDREVVHTKPAHWKQLTGTRC